MENIQFQGPGTYLIRLRGKVSNHLLEQLSEMTLNASEVSDDQDVTTLVGKIPSQPSLIHTLKELSDLHLFLLSVEHLEA